MADKYSYPYYRSLAIIRDKGTSVLITRKTQTYDPVQGRASSIVWTSTAVQALVMSTDSEFVLKEADTVTDMITILIAAKDIPIVPNMMTDDLIFAGLTYRIVNVLAGYVGPNLATYELRCQL